MKRMSTLEPQVTSKTLSKDELFSAFWRWTEFCEKQLPLQKGLEPRDLLQTQWKLPSKSSCFCQQLDPLSCWEVTRSLVVFQLSESAFNWLACSSATRSTAIPRQIGIHSGNQKDLIYSSVVEYRLGLYPQHGTNYHPQRPLHTHCPSQAVFVISIIPFKAKITLFIPHSS